MGSSLNLFIIELIVRYRRTVSCISPFFLLAICLISQGCTSSSLSEEELVYFVLDEDNGLRKSLQSEGYRTEIIYRPTDLLVAQEVKGDPPSEEKISSLKKKYGLYHYFELNISKGKKEALITGGGDNFNELIHTISFRMGENVNLTTSRQDTILISDYIHQRTFGLAKSNSLLFVFRRDEHQDDEWIQFNLKEFGLGLGNQSFRFETSNLNKSPKINFQETSTN